MSVTELKAQVEGLTLDERRQLTAFLVSIRHREMVGYRQKISEKIDDKAETSWVSFEEFDRRVSA